MKEEKDFFGVKKLGSSVKIEVFAGIATFLAMCYILTVNPNQILFGGTADPRWSSVFIATALGAIIGTLIMALFAKMPYAQASGMGLNALIGGVIGGTMGFGYSFGNAMLIVLLDGILFLIISIIPVKKDKETNKWVSLRALVFDGIPASVRNAIPVGIGLFIAFIGFQNAKIITASPYTLVEFIPLNNPENWANGGIACQAIVALFGLLVISLLSHFKVKGSVIIGILAATLLSIPLGVANIDILLGKTSGVTWRFWENFATFFSMNPDEGGVFFAAFTEGFSFPEGSLMTTIILIITFAMIDMFDTMGTIVGCAANAGLVDEKGRPLNYDKIMYSDSIATCAGAILGTSTVTTFVESGAGIAAGGKTGLTALTCAILFFLSLFLTPLFAFIPSAAAASALIYVGVLMLGNVKKIDFSSIKSSVPAFLTIIIMPLGYSITKGIGVGLITYVVLTLVIYVIDVIKYSVNKKSNEVSKPKFEISVVALIVTLLFIFYFLFSK